MVHLYIETDSKSPRTTSGWYGYILEYKGAVCGNFKYSRGTDKQLILYALDDALNRMTGPNEITIHMSNLYIKTALTKYVPNWAGRDWMSTRGEPVKYAALWEEVHEKLIAHKIAWDVQRKHEKSTEMLMEIERRKRE